MDPIPIINFDLKPKEKRLVEMFPNCICCAILGPSGIGKTNVLMSISMFKKPCEDIYLVPRTSFQEKYILLRKIIDNYNRGYQKKKNSFSSVISGLFTSTRKSSEKWDSNI